MKDKRSIKKTEGNKKEVKNTKTKEQEKIEKLMDIIISENKEVLKELAK